MSIRESVKRLPVVGPMLHDVYMRSRYGDGETLTIIGGPLAGYRWKRFTRTYNPEYVSGTYENALQQALTDRLKPGMTFYDVGANGGFFSLLGAHLVGPTGRVVAFEPHPETERKIPPQMRLNNKDKIVMTYAAAVSDRVGVAHFDDEGPSVMASIVEPWHERRTIKVPVTTLDDVVHPHRIPNVIKIDVEGAEMRVLRGAAKLIFSHRPDLLVELHSEEIAEQYHAHVSDLGYITSPVSSDRFVLSVYKSRDAHSHGQRFD